ncbi:hypothetical protein ACFQRK_09315 [Parapedobacter sp. GCM10030251]|uniref:hypothetical protein n=1 Tax=Parapedobacter sp. GCM10030251 TaxID=3273419 RepID=UPI00360EFDF6
MEKPLLNSLGAQQVLASLYDLPENQLQQESRQAQKNLVAWLEKHFDLKMHQLAYLENVPEGYFIFLSEKISHFLSLRLPIQLVTPYAADKKLPPIDHPGKLLITDESSTATYAPHTGYAITESLRIIFAIPPGED